VSDVGITLLGRQKRHAGAPHGACGGQRRFQLAQQGGAQQAKDVGQLRGGLLRGEHAEGDEQAAGRMGEEGLGRVKAHEK
jgi:hypothetical protein